jgi:ring-1,2-phenylacetyl-CoA epoxidase subunit PaaD
MEKIKSYTKSEILEFLEEVKDPEIPVLSLMDLGIIRDVKLDNGVEVVITPTYSGCPAMNMMEVQIISKLQSIGIQQAKVSTVLSPPWTTDWISTEGRRKLKEYGITPPTTKSTDAIDIINEFKKVSCPYCASANTEIISQFGSTPCKSLFRCIDCREPFDYFKCH